MLRVWLSACIIPVIVSIIVTDYPPTSTEYNYSYNVINPSTGDAKTMQEVRSGDFVRGSYSLIDPDGVRRTVKYTAGPKIGFKAVVHIEPEYSPITNQNSNNGNRHTIIGNSVPIPYLHKVVPVSTYLPVVNKNNRVYFTPGNTQINKPVTNEDQYFIPNKTYQSNII